MLVFGKGGRLKEQISRAGIFVFKRPPIWTTLLEHYVRWTMLVIGFEDELAMVVVGKYV